MGGGTERLESHPCVCVCSSNYILLSTLFFFFVARLAAARGAFASAAGVMCNISETGRALQED